MKGTLRLVLLLGFAAVGLYFVRGMPRDVTLVYDLEESTAVRSIEVDVRRGDGAVRHAEYRFPGGAPTQIRHDVKLPDGNYEVVVRVVRATGTPVRSVFPVVVDEAGPVLLPIRDRAARAD